MSLPGDVQRERHFSRPASRLIRALAATAAGLALSSLACGGSSTQTPTSPTTSGTRFLSISGATTLNPGATSQLSATVTVGTASGSTTTTAASVTWQTRDAGVATVTAGGLLTGVSVGQTLVSASADGLFAQAAVTVKVTTTGAPGTVITGCGAILTPGAYVLEQDLGVTSPCVSFSNTSNIQLNCQGHTVFGLALTNVSGATVQECTVTDKVTMTNVTSITLSRSTIGSVVVSNSSAVVIADNTLGSVLASSSSGVQVLRDTIAASSATYAVFLSGGMNNLVLQSTLTGGWTGIGHTGADDGVAIVNETGDTVQGNTINSFFDTAIEGVDSVSNTTIADNTGSNLGFFGIGSFWCTSWTNNIIRGNHFSNAKSFGFFTYDRSGSKCGVTVPQPGFSGNQFIGNVFRDSTVTKSPMLEVYMSGSVSGNLIQGNDFGPNDGPQLVPLSGFVDGGGNVCAPMNPAISNFPCTGGTSVNGRPSPRPPDD
jgi:Right handed beta helix region/Bacterial Ig-like domain (group 2)